MKTGRPRGIDPMRRVDIRLGTKDRERLARIKQLTGLDRSKAIRKAIKQLDSLLVASKPAGGAERPESGARALVKDGMSAPAPQPQKTVDEDHPLRANAADPIEPCPLCGRRLGRSLHATPHGKPPGTGGGKCEGVKRP